MNDSKVSRVEKNLDTGEYVINNLYGAGSGTLLSKFLTEEDAQKADFEAQVSALMGMTYSLRAPSKEVIMIINGWQQFGHLMLHHPGSPVVAPVLDRLAAARKMTVSTPAQVAAMMARAAAPKSGDAG